MIKSKNIKIIELSDWDDLVSKTYGRPYSFQQQEGCKSRGTFELTIPSDYTKDDDMYDKIPEIINDKIMGVKFKNWLERDPNKPVDKTNYGLGLWWERNFYPDIYTVANDLHKKKLIEAGEYLINIDW